MTIYEVNYLYDECVTPFRIGFFSSRESASAVINRLSQKAGFCDSPEGFYMLRREIPCTCCPEVFYEALIYFHTEDYDLDYGERLGLFLKKEDAKAAVEGYHKDNPQIIPNVEVERIVNRLIIGEVSYVSGFIKGERYDKEL